MKLRLLPGLGRPQYAQRPPPAEPPRVSAGAAHSCRNGLRARRPEFQQREHFGHFHQTLCLTPLRSGQRLALVLTVELLIQPPLHSHRETKLAEVAGSLEPELNRLCHAARIAAKLAATRTVLWSMDCRNEFTIHRPTPASPFSPRRGRGRLTLLARVLAQRPVESERYAPRPYELPVHDRLRICSRDHHVPRPRPHSKFGTCSLRLTSGRKSRKATSPSPSFLRR